MSEICPKCGKIREKRKTTIVIVPFGNAAKPTIGNKCPTCGK